MGAPLSGSIVDHIAHNRLVRDPQSGGGLPLRQVAFDPRLRLLAPRVTSGSSAESSNALQLLAQIRVDAFSPACTKFRSFVQNY
jgi:hypothetical protein